MVKLNSNGFIDIDKEYKKKLKSLGLDCWGEVKKDVEIYHVYNDSSDFSFRNLTRDVFFNDVEETYREYERSLRKNKLSPETFICKEYQYSRSQYRGFHVGEMFIGRMVDNTEPRYKYYYDNAGVCHKCFPIEKKLIRIYHKCINDDYSSSKNDKNNHHKDFFIDEFNKIFYTKNEIRLLKLKEISGEPNIWQKLYKERTDFLRSLKKCKYLGDPKDEYGMCWYNYHTNEIQYWKTCDDGDGILIYSQYDYDRYLNSFLNAGGMRISQDTFDGCFKDLDLKDKRKKKLNKINGLLDLQECS